MSVLDSNNGDGNKSAVDSTNKLFGSCGFLTISVLDSKNGDGNRSAVDSTGLVMCGFMSGLVSSSGSVDFSHVSTYVASSKVDCLDEAVVDFLTTPSAEVIGDSMGVPFDGDFVSSIATTGQ
jgi:hypothetical protein